MNDDEELDIEVDNIINQIKNQSRSLKKVENERPELRKEDLETFVLANASAIVLDSVEMIQTLKLDVMAGADAKMVESVSELVKATTAAIDSLSRLKLSDDKIRSQKELKKMDIDSKSPEVIGNTSGLFISREDLLKHLLGNKKKNVEEPTIDV